MALDIDECSLRNGMGNCIHATGCENLIGDFICHCIKGYMGRLCGKYDLLYIIAYVYYLHTVIYNSLYNIRSPFISNVDICTQGIKNMHPAVKSEIYQFILQRNQSKNITERVTCT